VTIDVDKTKLKKYVRKDLGVHFLWGVHAKGGIGEPGKNGEL